MSDLRTWYRAHLAGPLSKLEKARHALEGGSPEASDTIRALAHSLHGSGGTYGFSNISDAAVAVEEATDEELPTPLANLIETVRKPPRRVRTRPGRCSSWRTAGLAPTCFATS